MSAHPNPATVDACLRMGAGFSQNDRGWIVEQFSTLDNRLVAFDADKTDIELSVKDRANRGQKVTLECSIAGQHRILATSAEEWRPTAAHSTPHTTPSPRTWATGPSSHNRVRPASSTSDNWLA